MKSTYEQNLEQTLFAMLSDEALEVARFITNDEEIHHWQDQSNAVSIRRLGYNDHGPVHMRKVAINAMNMFNILIQEGIQPSIVKEDTGSVEDSRIAVLLAAFLHDIGMSIGRQNHEISSFVLSERIIDRILNTVIPNQLRRQITIKSVTLEGIMGHMTHHAISSLEAGIILVADGCDMEKGRSRIPMLISHESRVGDIHKYSSSSVERVTIEKGAEKPIKISIEMSASVGFFQVEEILIGKIMASTIKQYIELYANVIGRDVKRYL
ncbi:MAG: phosphohydrolase [Clostridiaceae bacterium]|jgi:metal-dependent HD superfamily phosphatase/phosphodiesterase|nr:phosphohydrolase [Clostridiaceae bacterium]